MPVYIVCAFVKRLARLCLTAPAYGALIALPMLYNLLRRHPKALVLLHRELPAAPAPAADAPVLLIDAELHAHQAQLGRDPCECPAALLCSRHSCFLAPDVFEEKELQRCGATESSLWELEALLRHYHPSVVRMAQLFETARLQKQPFDIAAFSKLTYDSVGAALCRHAHAHAHHARTPKLSQCLKEHGDD